MDPTGGAESPPERRCKRCGDVKALTTEHWYADPGAPGGYRYYCRPCTRAYNEERRQARLRAASEPAMTAVQEFDLASEIEAGGDVLASYGSPMERASAEALIRLGSVAAAAGELQLSPRQLRAHLDELRRRAATRGWSPNHDMTKTAPDPYRVKGVSTLYDAGGNVVQQWVKTHKEQDDKLAALLDAMAAIADQWQGRLDPIEAPPRPLDDDLLCVYPMGDPHLGMFAWGEETGADFDLKIAERNLFGAVDHLVGLAPRSKHALIVNLGDFFHADNSTNQTLRSHHALDVDTRWAKVLRVGIRTMRRCIDRALEKHETVRVICEIGNHDDHSAVMLSACLAQAYEREPRVSIDTSPSKYHWHRFGKVLIGVTHGDTVKKADLPGVMACDRPADWGETLFRYWLTGHIHHDSLREYAGVTVESFRTLAPGDAWHRGQGYRAGQDMKLIVMHREHGEVNRHTVGIRQLFTSEGT